MKANSVGPLPYCLRVRPDCICLPVRVSVQLLGGYLYFHKAPNTQEFFEETRDKVDGFDLDVLQYKHRRQLSNIVLPDGRVTGLRVSQGHNRRF